SKSWQKNFKDSTGWEPKTYKRILLWYLDELDKLIDDRVLKYGKLQMKEKEFQAIKEIEKWLKENEMQKQESLVSEGTALEASLVIKGVALEDCLVTDDADLEASLVTNGAYLEASLVNDGAALEDCLVTNDA
ncbi:hypothetical protein Tco_1249741, partial [Tanacetum coccineum]